MAFINLQIDYLLYLQHFREIAGSFNDVILFITNFGQVVLPLLIISFIYWCIDTKKGLFILLNSVFAVLFNEFVKNTFCIYRPWILDARVKPLPICIPMSSGYSFPSGHVAIATGVFGGIAFAWWKNKILRYSSIIFALLVLFSRNWLGVHTPQDVIVSLILGIGILCATDNILKWAEKGRYRDLIIAALLFLFALFVITYCTLKTYPTDFLAGKIIVDPTKCWRNIYPKVGLFLGSVLGWILQRRFIKFNAQNGSVPSKVLRFLLFGGILTIWISFGFPIFTNTFGWLLGGFLEFLLIGLYITAFVPFVIKSFNFVK